MKSKILVLILLFVITLPQVVSAAWWNPFSWKIFHRTDTKTQILENRIQELEKKLGASSTSTESNTKPTTSQQSQTKTIIEKKQNFNTSRLELVDGLLTFLNTYINTSKEMIKDAQIFYLEPIIKRRNYVKNLNTINDKSLDALIGFDNEVLEYYVDDVNKILPNLERLLTLESLLKQERSKISKTFYENKDLSQTEKTFFIDKLNESQGYFDVIYNSYQDMAKSSTEYESEYKAALSRLIAYSSRESERLANVSIPTYSHQPIIVPQIQMPKTTNCSIGPMAGARGYYTISCN